MGEAPVSVQSFPNAPGVVTIVWDHAGGEDLYWFALELEGAGVGWYPDRDKRAWTVTGLEGSQTYRFRVCAVHLFDSSCSDWTTVTTLPYPHERPPATPVPPPKEAVPAFPPDVGSYEPTGLPGMLARHRNSLAEISPISSDLDRADGTFHIRRAGGGSIRLEATNFPGQFLRHQNFRVLLQPDDGSELFRQDSTFRPTRAGVFIPTRLESVNFPGHFVRHRNFEIWIDPDDGSQLFASDASWRRLPPPSRKVPPAAMALESHNFPGHLMRHRDGLGFITTVRNDLDRLDSTFVVRQALIRPGEPTSPGYEGAYQISVSLESLNFPGHFLRHQDWRIKLHRNDDTLQFRQDATFMYQSGNDSSGTANFSLESVNFPGHFVRHTNFELWLAANDETELFGLDASWRPVPSLVR